jgi:hypothetical protein
MSDEASDSTDSDGEDVRSELEPPFEPSDWEWLSRRDLIAGTAGGVALGGAGCLDDNTGSAGTPTFPPTSIPTDSPTPTPEPTPRDVELTGDSVTLVENGEPRATIMISAEPLEVTETAIADLRDTVETMTGARLPTAEPGEAVETDQYLWVGHHPELETLFPEVDLDFEEHEESVIAAGGSHLAIVGADGPNQWGTKQAVYTFLQEHLDVRWLWPGDLGEDVPKRESITFDSFTDRHTPALEQRVLMGPNLMQQEALKNDIPGIENDEQFGKERSSTARAWHRRHRDTPRWFKAAHNFWRWWDMYGEDHPLYFALQPNGERGPASTNSKHTKLCVSNPDVADQWLQDMTADLDANPTRRVLSASPNDARFRGYCVCDDGEHETNGDCRAWDPDPADAPTVELEWSDTTREFVALTDRYVRFWNRLARRLRDQRPDHDLMVGAWAYGAYRTPPVETELHEDIGIGYVGNGMPEALPATRERDRQEWDGWSQKAETLLWRPNLFHLRPGIPSLFMHRSAEDIQYMTERNLSGVQLARCYHHWATQGLQYYVFMQLVWDPSQDVDEIIDEWVTRAVGEAAAPVLREYVDLLESKTSEVNEQVGSYADASLEQYSTYAEVFDEAFIERAWSIIEDMRSAVEGERHGERVEFFAAGLEFTEIQMDVIDALTGYKRSGGEDTAALSEARRAAQRREEFLQENLDSWAISRIMLHNQRNWAEGSGVIFPPDVTELSTKNAIDLSQGQITVDGDLDGTDGLTALRIDSDFSTYSGGEGKPLSGSVWLGWDDEALYLSARLVDDVHSPAPVDREMIWPSDLMQLGVTPRKSEAWEEFTIGLTKDGPRANVRRFPQETTEAYTAGQIEVTRDEEAGETHYEVALPWDTLSASADADAIGLSVAIADYDDGDQAGLYEWAGGIFGGKDRTKYRPARLTGE